MSNWISVKDRLPDKEGEYLTASNISGKVVMYYVLDFKITKRFASFVEYDDENLDMHKVHVDAWMPIEPYEGVKG